VAATETAVKKYVVRLSAEERARLDSVIHRGKHPAQRLMKARILLKADAGEAGEAWSDSQIAKALDTSLATIPRTRQQLVEEGFAAVLTSKHSPASAGTRIFDCTAGESFAEPLRVGDASSRESLRRMDFRRGSLTIARYRLRNRCDGPVRLATVPFSD
jgi:hypothetical protein